MSTCSSVILAMSVLSTLQFDANRMNVHDATLINVRMESSGPMQTTLIHVGSGSLCITRCLTLLQPYSHPVSKNSLTLRRC